jgi:hypothetical protein
VVLDGIGERARVFVGVCEGMRGEGVDVYVSFLAFRVDGEKCLTFGWVVGIIALFCPRLCNSFYLWEVWDAFA